jgi:SAM-dependent methyltransferase
MCAMGTAARGDVDYGEIGGSYARFRQPDPAIAEQILHALGDARTVLNVGAGTGSYEPTDREVTAVEPSASMRAQRPASLSAAIDAVAERLPFAAASFDASMAIVTVHQWSDLEKGLAEMRRVTSGPVVLLVCDPDLMKDYWLNDYIPEVRAIEANRFPSIHRIATALGGQVEVEPVRFRSTAAMASTSILRPARGIARQGSAPGLLKLEPRSRGGSRTVRSALVERPREWALGRKIRPTSLATLLRWAATPHHGHAHLAAAFALGVRASIDFLHCNMHMVCSEASLQRDRARRRPRK